MTISVKGITTSAVIAAAYVVLALPFASVGFGPVQFRIAEVFTVLPFLSPYAILGNFIGCFVSNMLFSTPLDMVVGSLATLLAAFLTYKCKNVYTAALPPVIVNALIIGTMLAVISDGFTPILLLSYIGSIALSQFIVCFVLGIPFIKLLQRYKLDKLMK